MLLSAFEPATPASERQQTHTLNRAAIGIDPWIHISTKAYRRNQYLSLKPKLKRKKPVELRQ
jgi:hypothetical protein